MCNERLEFKFIIVFFMPAFEPIEVFHILNIIYCILHSMYLGRVFFQENTASYLCFQISNLWAPFTYIYNAHFIFYCVDYEV